MAPGPVHDIQQLQAKLARRLSLLFLLPVFGLLAIGTYAYDLNSRLAQIEVGTKAGALERLWEKTRNYELAIFEYEKLNARHPTPEIMTRLATLYHMRAQERQDDYRLVRFPDEKLAIATLKDANALHQKLHGTEFWYANSTLSAIYLARGEAYWAQAVEVGEKALKENPYDDQSYNNLAWIHAVSTNPDLQDLAKAERYAERAVQLTLGKDVDALETLRDVYRARGGNQKRIQDLERLAAELKNERVA